MDGMKGMLQAAFPDQEWDDDRVEAFRDAVYSCQDSPEEEEESEEEEEPLERPGRGMSKGGGLALIFGNARKGRR